MGIEVTGTATLVDAEGNTVTITPNELDSEVDVHASDRGMGAEYCHIFTYVEDDGVEWHVYEYPEGAVNHVEKPQGVDLVQDFAFEGRVD